jgi:hypothetical protein
VHAKTIGVVLNEVTKSTGYGYGYGKRYGYGEYASTGAAANGDGTQPVGAGPMLPRFRKTTQPRTGEA